MFYASVREKGRHWDKNQSLWCFNHWIKLWLTVKLPWQLVFPFPYRWARAEEGYRLLKSLKPTELGWATVENHFIKKNLHRSVTWTGNPRAEMSKQMTCGGLIHLSWVQKWFNSMPGKYNQSRNQTLACKSLFSITAIFIITSCFCLPCSPSYFNTFMFAH